MKKSNKKRSLDMYAGGTGATGVAPKGATGLGMLTDILPTLLDGLSQVLDGDNQAQYSKQPILNAATIKGMSTPYSFGFGGSVDDLSNDELAQVQQIAEEHGISLEDAVALIQQGDTSTDDNVDDGNGDEESNTDEDNSGDNTDEDQSEFAYGGIHINPKNKGKFNAIKKRTGKTTEELTHSKNPLTRKRAVFAKNAKTWKHAFGGVANNQIEVEGNEAVETPDGKVTKIKGPRHEEGGVDIDVPSGTKIYSDRIKVGGKTMQERKINREKNINRIHKLILKDPTNKFLQNSLKRTVDTVNSEEEYDMNIQKAINDTAKKFGYGGQVKERKYPFGGTDGQDPYFDKYGWHYPHLVKSIYQSTDLNPVDRTSTGDVTDMGDITKAVKTPNLPKTTTPSVDQPASTPFGKLGVGDYVGMFGNLFNAVAPIINTRNDAKNNKPNINRFTGFGHDALDDNQQAQNFIAGTRSNALTDAETSANSSYVRNRNSASSVNTVRALDTVTDIVKGKQKNTIEDSFSKGMMGLLGQRSQLHNIKDKMVMSGETARDLEDKADMDNFYSNLAENLTNFGTNIQGIGRNLNTAKSNKVDAKVLSQMSRYGLSFDDNGNLVSTKK